MRPAFQAADRMLRTTHAPEHAPQQATWHCVGPQSVAAELASKQKDAQRLQQIMETAPTAAAKDISEKALIGLGVLDCTGGLRWNET